MDEAILDLHRVHQAEVHDVDPELGVEDVP
jgi:hypothetical protein